tara:strand:- start:545 stop:712 length:168 start_codon:yes stop_codon:yes gene_type:complete
MKVIQKENLSQVSGGFLETLFVSTFIATVVNMITEDEPSVIVAYDSSKEGWINNR